MSKKQKKQDMEFIATSIKDSLVGISEILYAWDNEYEEPLSFNDLEVASVISVFVHCMTEQTIQMVDNDKFTNSGTVRVDKQKVKEQYLNSLFQDIQRILEVYTTHKMADLFEIVE